MFSSITEHPDLHFLFVINPNSGPGDGAQPDENYQQCIPKLLEAGSNVEVLAFNELSLSASALTNLM